MFGIGKFYLKIFMKNKQRNVLNICSRRSVVLGNFEYPELKISEEENYFELDFLHSNFIKLLPPQVTIFGISEEKTS